MKAEILRISATSKFSIAQIEVDKDHLHLLTHSTPTISALQIVRKLKQETTFSMWKHFPQVLENCFNYRAGIRGNY